MPEEAAEPQEGQARTANEVASSPQEPRQSRIDVERLKLVADNVFRRFAYQTNGPPRSYFEIGGVRKVYETFDMRFVDHEGWNQYVMEQALMGALEGFFDRFDVARAETAPNLNLLIWRKRLEIDWVVGRAMPDICRIYFRAVAWTVEEALTNLWIGESSREDGIALTSVAHPAAVTGQDPRAGSQYDRLPSVATTDGLNRALSQIAEIRDVDRRQQAMEELGRTRRLLRRGE
jgi:hypothetical protein